MLSAHRRGIGFSDVGIYVAPMQIDSTPLVTPVHGFAVLVGLQPHAIPCLLRFELGITYPQDPISVEFISRVSHPLITADGRIDLNILQHDWSQALSIRTVLISLQAALTEPAHPDILVNGCIQNPDWEAGGITTPPQHVPQLFNLLLDASCPPAAGDTLDVYQWHFLRGLRSLLSIYPWVYGTSFSAWCQFLQSLASVCNILQDFIIPDDPSAHVLAKQCWVVEAEAILTTYKLDGLRMILCMHALRGHVGELQKVRGVWPLIRSFISDIENQQLLGRNRSLLMAVESDFTLRGTDAITDRGAEHVDTAQRT